MKEKTKLPLSQEDRLSVPTMSSNSLLALKTAFRVLSEGVYFLFSPFYYYFYLFIYFTLSSIFFLIPFYSNSIHGQATTTKWRSVNWALSWSRTTDTKASIGNSTIFSPSRNSLDLPSSMKWFCWQCFLFYFVFYFFSVPVMYYTLSSSCLYGPDLYGDAAASDAELPSAVRRENEEEDQ
jgi:hypothetical protein